LAKATSTAFDHLHTSVAIQKILRTARTQPYSLEQADQELGGGAVKQAVDQVSQHQLHHFATTS
jgi:hypothetical protein